MLLVEAVLSSLTIPKRLLVLVDSENVTEGSLLFATRIGLVVVLLVSSSKTVVDDDDDNSAAAASTSGGSGPTTLLFNSVREEENDPPDLRNAERSSMC